MKISIHVIAICFFTLVIAVPFLSYADVSPSLANRKVHPIKYQDGLYEVYNIANETYSKYEPTPTGDEKFYQTTVYAPCDKNDTLVTGGCFLKDAGTDGAIVLNAPDLYSPARGEGRFGLGLGWECTANFKTKEASQSVSLVSQAVCKKN